MSRSSQPYRRGGLRPPGQALQAMLKGSTASGWNPMDVKRGQILVQAALRKRRGRTSRPGR